MAVLPGDRPELAVLLMRTNTLARFTLSSTGALVRQADVPAPAGTRALGVGDIRGEGRGQLLSAAASKPSTLNLWSSGKSGLQPAESLAMSSAPGRMVVGRFAGGARDVAVVSHPFEPGGLGKVYGWGKDGLTVVAELHSPGLVAMAVAPLKAGEPPLLLTVSRKPDGWRLHRLRGSKFETVSEGPSCTDAYTAAAYASKSESVVAIGCLSGAVELSFEPLTPKRPAPVRLLAGVGVYDVLLEDLNHDGFVDLAAVSLRAHELRIWHHIAEPKPVSQSLSTGRGPGRIALQNDPGGARPSIFVLTMEAHRLELWRPESSGEQ